MDMLYQIISKLQLITHNHCHHFTNIIVYICLAWPDKYRNYISTYFKMILNINLDNFLVELDKLKGHILGNSHNELNFLKLLLNIYNISNTDLNYEITLNNLNTNKVYNFSSEYLFNSGHKNNENEKIFKDLVYNLNEEIKKKVIIYSSALLGLLSFSCNNLKNTKININEID
ncbi:MAG: hypothetical protein [Cotesia congregata filamentous virus 2]